MDERTSRLAPDGRGRARRTGGFSVIELLILIAILGIIAGVVAVNGRRVLGGQQERAAITSVRQAVWEGATAASARGADTELVRTASGLEVRDVATGDVLRTFAIPATVTTNLSSGQLFVFGPPGRIDQTASTWNLNNDITLDVNGHTYKLQVSLIGEVKVTS